MMTWFKADTLFKSARNKVKGKPIGRNLRIVYIPTGDRYGIKFHNTCILIIDRQGNYAYNTDGWTTITTKKHMNTYGPAKVYQHKHIWYINGDHYVDGIIYNVDAELLTRPIITRVA